MTGGLEVYHSLEGSASRWDIKARGLGEEEMVVIYLEKSVVRISSESTEKRDIKTSRFSAGIESNHLTMENKPQQYIRIGKLFHIYFILITFCT